MTSQSEASSERSGSRDLRAELLRTSRKLLDESGPSALSMREVARRAGCTHQAPYHYFANREAILAALVREGFDELADRLASAREGLEGTDRRVMFRPDVCDPERFPEVVQASERARDELARLARRVVGEETSLEIEVLFWSGVHGLASLLLDGPLVGAFGSVQERLEFARGVVGLSEVPVAGGLHESRDESGESA